MRFTRQGYQKIQDEYDQLTKDRVQAVEALRTAREMGDLSENAAYKVARHRLSQTDSRLQYLKKLLVEGKIARTTFTGAVAFGTSVTVEKENGKVVTYSIVEGFESDPSTGKLSTSSPIGRALLGKKVGDSINVSVPAGNISLKISNIEPLE